MPRDLTVSDSVTVAADAHTIWSALADPTQMPRWSPENTGADVTSPSTVGSPLAVGDTFVGSNRRGRARWHTRCVVVAADPGRRFAFDVQAIGVRRPLLRATIARWDYTLEPAADGSTVVTETWRDGRRRWPDALAAVFDKAVTGGRLFADFQRTNIRRTLDRLKADFEGTAA